MDSFLSAGLAQASDTVIINQLINILNESFKCDQGYKQIIRAIITNVFKTFSIFIIAYFVKNSDKIVTVLKIIGRTLFYKKLLLNTSKDKSFIINVKKFVNETDDFPIYLRNANEIYELEYCHLLHNKKINLAIEYANQDDSIAKKKACVVKTLQNKVYSPSTLFPSANYVMINNIISSFFDIVQDTNMYKVCVILLDGKPGLGKSMSCEYIASLGLYDNVYYIDLITEYRTFPFSKIVDSILSINPEGRTVVYIDELDKYLAQYIKVSYQKMVEQQMRKVKGKDEENGIHIPDIEDYEVQIRESVLGEMLRLFETKIFSDGIVLVFCSNNMSTLFDNIDMTHFKSLRDRFTCINFKECDKTELKRFIRYFNDKIQKRVMYYEEAVLEQLLDTIRDDISITYRAVKHCHTVSCYDTRVFVDVINKFKEQEYVLSPSRKAIPMNLIIDIDKKKEYTVESKEKARLAIEGGFYGIIEKMLEDDEIDTNIQISYQNLSYGTIVTSLLTIACLKNNVDMVKLLLNYDADVNSVDAHGRTALCWYTFMPNIKINSELIKLLLQRGLKPKLFNIVRHSNSVSILEILSDSVDYTQLSEKNETLLFGCDYRCISYLLEKNININHQDNDGNSALHLSVTGGNQSSYNLLIQKGIDVNLKNKASQTASDLCRMYGRNSWL